MLCDFLQLEWCCKRPIYFYKHTDKLNKDIYLNSGILGKISAVSLDAGEIVWQIPAGTYRINDNQILIGSPSYGGIASIQDRDKQSISFFTGSYDKKIYAINNDNGNYVWSDDLPASGSSIPLIQLIKTLVLKPSETESIAVYFKQ